MKLNKFKVGDLISYEYCGLDYTRRNLVGLIVNKYEENITGSIRCEVLWIGEPKIRQTWFYESSQLATRI